MILLAESWETQSVGKWDAFLQNWQFYPTGGRYGTAGLSLHSTASWVEKWLGRNASTLITHFGYKYVVAQPGAGRPFEMRDGTQVQTYITIDGPSGVISAYRGDGLLLGSYSVGTPLNDGIYRHYQVKVVFHASAGSVQVKLQNNLVLNLTNVSTIVSANAYANRYRMTAAQQLGFEFQDDIVVCDEVAPNNDFLGDVRVQPVYPTGPGTYTEWAANGAASNWQCVDEAVPNNDTDYVSSSTAGARDTYALGNLSATSGSVKGVQVTLVARKDDAGNRTIAPLVRSQGVDSVGNNIALLDSYKSFYQVYDVDPSDNASWDIDRVNALEVGVKLIA